MVLITLFVFLLVVIIIMQSKMIKKLEVGQAMCEEAIDQLYEIVFPDEEFDECDMCGDQIEPLTFEEWLREDMAKNGLILDENGKITTDKKVKKTPKKAKKSLTKKK